MGLALQSPAESQPGHPDCPVAFKHLTHWPLAPPFLLLFVMASERLLLGDGGTHVPPIVLQGRKQPRGWTVPSTACRSPTLEARTPPTPLHPPPHPTPISADLSSPREERQVLEPHIPFPGAAFQKCQVPGLTESLSLWKRTR